MTLDTDALILVLMRKLKMNVIRFFSVVLFVDIRCGYHIFDQKCPCFRACHYLICSYLNEFIWVVFLLMLLMFYINWPLVEWFLIRSFKWKFIIKMVDINNSSVWSLKIEIDINAWNYLRISTLDALLWF